MALPQSISEPARTPGSAHEVGVLIREAEEARPAKRVRAVGSGHSFSDITCTDGMRIDISRIKDVTLVGAAADPAGGESCPLVKIGAGATIRRINRSLDALGLALENMGSYDGQQIAGAVSTGTHGSGLKFGPLASQVQALTIVTTGGVAVPLRARPEIGSMVTVGGRTIPEADAFKAVVVSMGCMGVIVDMTLRVTQKYELYETRRLRDWSEVLRELQHGSLLTDHRHVEVYLSPYPSDGPRRCLLTLRDRADHVADSRRARRHRSAFSELSGPLTMIGRGTLLHQLKTPQSAAKALACTLRGLQHKGYCDRSHRVLNLRGENEVVKLALGIEHCFPLGPRGGLPDAAICAIDGLLALAESKPCPRSPFLSSPLALRFVGGAEAFLAPQHGQDCVTIELGVLRQIPGANAILEECAATMTRAGGRPHWGLDVNFFDGTFARRIYPEFDRWERVYETFNHRGTFCGPFTERMGLADPSKGDRR